MAARPTANSKNGGTQGTTTQTAGPSTQVQTSSGSTRETSSSTTTTNSRTQNMTDSALAALDNLIAGLSGSKSSNPAVNAILQQQGTFNKAVLNAQQLQTDYSKEAAREDSAAAVSATMAQALEKAMPQITAGIDAAGTSGSAMSALLTQQAATDAARESAKLGLSAAIDYGNISVNAGQQITALLNSGDPAINALLNALGVAKGAVSETNETTTSVGSSTSKSTSQTTTVDSGKTVTSSDQSGPSGTKKSTNTFKAPASSAVTKNTGSGWQTTYGN